jgi:DNA-binding transcriptional ArsR family regulator
VTDPVTLRAVAHPMRLKLIGMVGINGTLTASQAAKQLDSTPAVTAYHLRTLAKYGFVEDAGSSSARERPWRLTERAVSFSWSGEDPAGQAMTRVAYAEWFEHVHRYEQYLQDYPQEVRDASSATERVLFATPEEVAELTEKIRDLLEPFEERVDPARRPPGVTTPMEILLFTHPLPPEYSPQDS